MKTYEYDKKRYFFEIKLIGIICIALLGVSLIAVFIQRFSILWAFVTLITCYTLWNMFISNSNPKIVKISEEFICFQSFYREDIYYFKEINNLRIREFPSAGKMFIRVNEAKFIKGRYWISTKSFNNGKDLFNSLLDIEYHMFPDTLKGKARKVNTEYIEKKRKSK